MFYLEKNKKKSVSYTTRFVIVTDLSPPRGIPRLPVGYMVRLRPFRRYLQKKKSFVKKKKNVNELPLFLVYGRAGTKKGKGKEK